MVMRYGENALNLIERVKAKLKEIEPSLPSGVNHHDLRSVGLIERSIDTLTEKLLEEIAIVSLVILIFPVASRPRSFPSSPFRCRCCYRSFPCIFWGWRPNLMSLSGIAISIGVLVDGAIVEVENACKKLQLWDQNGGRVGDFHACGYGWKH